MHISLWKINNFFSASRVYNIFHVLFCTTLFVLLHFYPIISIRYSRVLSHIQKRQPNQFKITHKKIWTKKKDWTSCPNLVFTTKFFALFKYEICTCFDSQVDLSYLINIEFKCKKKYLRVARNKDSSFISIRFRGFYYYFSSFFLYIRFPWPFFFYISVLLFFIYRYNRMRK